MAWMFRPPHSTAIGVPARVVATRDPRTGATQRLEQLPDPEGAMLRSLHESVQRMEERILELESAIGSQAYHIAALSAAHSNGNGNGHHAPEGDDPFDCLQDEDAIRDEAYWSSGLHI